MANIRRKDSRRSQSPLRQLNPTGRQQAKPVNDKYLVKVVNLTYIVQHFDVSRVCDAQCYDDN